MPSINIKPQQPGDDTVGKDQLADNAVDLSATAAASTVTVTNTAGDDAVLPAAVASTTAGVITAADQAKLDGIATAATANAADAALRDRATHTGTQTVSTLSDFAAEVLTQVTAIVQPGANVTVTPSGSTLVVASTAAGGGGVADGTFGDIQVTGTGTVWSIVANAVGTTEIADMSVTTGKLQNNAVTLAKVGSDVISRANHTGSQLAATISDFTEAAQDAIGGMFVDGAGITTSYNDVANQLTITAHAHSNSAVLDTITDAGSGVIMSAAERTKLGYLTVSGSVSLDDLPVANMADIATGTLLGRTDSGTGPVSAINQAGIQSLVGALPTANIDDAAITMAKIENLAQNEFVGRVTAGSGPPAKLTATQARNAIGITDIGSGIVITNTERDKLSNISVSGAVNLDDISPNNLADIASATVIGRTDPGVGVPSAIGQSGLRTIIGALPTTSIGDSAITMAKIENLSQNEFVGRVDSDSGPPTKLTSTQALTALGITDVGSGAIITTTERDKVGHITVTQAVNLDTMESDIASNTTTATNASSTATAASTTATTASTNASSALASVTLLDAHTGRTKAALGLTGDGVADDTAALQTLLTAGGEIYLPEGDYRITWTSGATYGINMSQAGTKLIGCGIGRTKLIMDIGTPSTTTTAGLRIAASNCRIEGMTIEQDALPARDRVEHLVSLTSAATGCALRDLDVVGTDSGATYSTYPSPVLHIEGNQGGSIGIYLDQADDCYIENVSSRDFKAGQRWNNWGSYGMQLEGCKRVTVYSSRFNYNFYDGVKLTDSAARAEHNMFYGCEFTDNGRVVPLGLTSETDGNKLGNGNGIDIDCKHTRLFSCVAKSNYGSGLQAKGLYVVGTEFISCYVTDSKAVGSIKTPGIAFTRDEGTYLTESYGAEVLTNNHFKVVNCQVEENAGNGISVNQGIEGLIHGNSVRSNGLLGIALSDETVRCVVSQNHVFGNGVTDATNTAYGIHVQGGAHIIDGNWISGIDSQESTLDNQTEYRAATPLTDRGIQVNASTNAEAHIICNNFIEEMAIGLYINVSSGTAHAYNNYKNDGSSTTRLIDGILPTAALGKKHSVALTNLRVWDSVQSLLPTTAAADDMALIPGTWGSASPVVQTRDAKALGATTHYARFQYVVDADHYPGRDIYVRVHAEMITTVADTTATIDLVAYEPNLAGGIGTDLCATAAQSINSLTAADYDFQITDAGLVAGDVIDIRVAIAINDAATGTAVIGQIGSIEVYE